MNLESSLKYILKILGFVCLVNGSLAAGVDSTSDPEFLVGELSSIWHVNKNGFGIRKVFSKYYADLFQGLDYHLEKNLMFWTTFNVPYYQNGSISSTPLISTEVEPKRRLVELGNWDPISLAVDYVNDKLYVVDGLGSQINVFDLDGKNRHIILNDLKGPREIVLDPNEGLMFISDDTGISRVNMDGKLLTNIYGCNSCNVSIAIDPIDKKIYRCASEENSSRKVVSSDYSGQNVKDVSEAVVQYKMAVFGDHVYFNENDEYIRKAEFGSNKVNDIENYQNIPDKRNAVMSLKVIHSTLQKSTTTNPCKENNGGCEQMCLLTPGPENHLSSGCSCSFGYILSENSKTCKPIQDYLMYVQGAKLRTIILDEDVSSSNLAIQPLDSPFFVFGGFDYDPINRIGYSAGPIDSEIHILKPPTHKFELFFKEKGKGTGVDVAYDWMSQNLYYLNIRKKDTELTVVNTRDKPQRKVLLANLRDAKKVFVHPHRGFVYVHHRSRSSNKIIRINTDGSDFTEIARWPLKRELQDSSSMAIDFTTDRIYWISANVTYSLQKKEYLSIVEINHADLNGDDPKKFTAQVECKPLAITVLKKWLYISCDKSIWRLNKETGEDKNKFKDLSSWSEDIKAISLPLLKENEPHPCKINNGDCAKLCFAIPDQTSSNSELTKVCSCPNNEVLKDGVCEKVSAKK